jgi:hypothetical protein
LVGVAVAIASKPLFNKVTLIREGSQVSLDFARFGAIPLVLGPGCSNLALTPHRDNLDHATLSWSSAGKPHTIQVRWLESGNRAGGAEFGDEWPDLGDQAVLLPSGRVLFLKPTQDSLFVLERWEGSLGDKGRCTIWIYEPHEGRAPNREWSFEDGHDLGTPHSSERTAGDDFGWKIGESYPSGSRAFKVPPGQDHGTYVLVTPDEKFEVVLERTYRAEWSAGDGLPK